MSRGTRATFVAALALIAAALAPGSASAATVCNNVSQSYGSTPVKVGNEEIARLHFFATDNFTRSCTVLRATKWKGTPHYMFVRVCKELEGPPPLVGKNCSGWDAGQYEFYAGPIYHPQVTCQVVRVKVDSPSGNRVVDRWVSGPCD